MFRSFFIGGHGGLTTRRLYVILIFFSCFVIALSPSLADDNQDSWVENIEPNEWYWVRLVDEPIPVRVLGHVLIIGYYENELDRVDRIYGVT